MDVQDYLALLLIGFVIVAQAEDDVVAGVLDAFMYGHAAALAVLVADVFDDQAVPLPATFLYARFQGLKFLPIDQAAHLKYT